MKTQKREKETKITDRKTKDIEEGRCQKQRQIERGAKRSQKFSLMTFRYVN